MRNTEIQRNHWDKLIKKLLKDNNPCAECLVAPRCTKSISDGTACLEFIKAMSEAIEEYANENKT